MYIGNISYDMPVSAILTGSYGDYLLEELVELIEGGTESTEIVRENGGFRLRRSFVIDANDAMRETIHTHGVDLAWEALCNDHPELEEYERCTTTMQDISGRLVVTFTFVYTRDDTVDDDDDGEYDDDDDDYYDNDDYREYVGVQDPNRKLMPKL